MTQFRTLLLAVSVTTACAGLQPATAKWIPETFENPLPEASAYLGGSVEEHRLEVEHKKHAKDIADVETGTKEEPPAAEEEPAPRPKRLAPVYHAAPPPAELDPEPHFRKALKATRDKKYEDAIKELKIALELKPAYYEAQAQLALVYQVVGKNKQAENLYTQLLELRPEMDQVHTNYGALLGRLGRLDEAEQEFKKAIELKWFSLQPHYNLANLLVERNKLQEALKEYKLCAKLDPSNAQVHNNLGVIFLQRNYLEEAKEEFTKAVHLAPTSKSFQANLDLANKQLHARGQRPRIQTAQKTKVRTAQKKKSTL